MKRHLLGMGVGFGLLLGVAVPALAAPGFATGNVNLRAGPGTGYPQVVVVPNGAPVEIFGCLQGYGWCDVGFNGVRGWVSSGYLQYLYEGRRVPFTQYYGRAGVPVVGFTFGDYWGEHYRDRPWFADRDRWGGPPPRGPRGLGWDRGGPPGPGFDPARGGRPDWDRGPGRGPEFRGGPDRGPEFRGGPDRAAERGPDRGPVPEFRGGPGGPGGGERGPRPGEDRGRGDHGPGDNRGPPGGPPGPR